MVRNYGRRIQKRRKELGMSTAELGRKCDVSASSIQAYEGEYRIPRDVVKFKLATALKCKVEDLFF